jgi:phospholipid/cholesterol/gamma-HCH transport system substrate-binding protein
MDSERRDVRLRLRVGVFVLAALAAFVGTIYALGARARLFEARYTIHAEFTEVGGLKEGATVRLAGVQIGRVTGIYLPGQPGGRVRVDMTVGRQFADRVRKNSVARIETQGLLGDRIVELGVGTADAPPTRDGDTIASREAMDLAGMIREGAGLMELARQTADSARRTLERLDRAVERVDRVVERVENGPGLAHALIYDEPVALRSLNATLAATQALLARVERGEGAAGVLTGADGTEAARRFVAAMDRLGRMLDRPGAEEGLLPTLLFDPQYKPVLEDLRVVARNLRDVSERVVGGRGTLGALLRDEGDGLRQTTEDLRVAVANLRAITDKISQGEGTLGALVEDPTVYEKLVQILDGAQRSFLLRTLIRGLAAPRAE